MTGREVRELEITRVGPMSAAKVAGAMYAILGFIAGAFITVFALAGAGGEGLLFGAGAIVFLPIIYGVIGFVAGAITAAIYNFIAPKIGGVELEMR